MNLWKEKEFHFQFQLILIDFNLIHLFILNLLNFKIM